MILPAVLVAIEELVRELCIAVEAKASRDLCLLGREVALQRLLREVMLCGDVCCVHG